MKTGINVAISCGASRLRAAPTVRSDQVRRLTPVLGVSGPVLRDAHPALHDLLTRCANGRYPGHRSRRADQPFGGPLSRVLEETEGWRSAAAVVDRALERGRRRALDHLAALRDPVLGDLAAGTHVARGR